MPQYTVEEPSAADGPIPEDEVLAARVVQVFEKEKTTKSGEKYTVLNWKFQIDDPDSDYDGKTVYGETGSRWFESPECKPLAWYRMVLGQTVGAGMNINTDDCEGETCRVVIGNREYEKDGEQKIYVFVRDVLPARGTSIVEEPF